MSIVNRLMAEIEEIRHVIIAVGKIEFQKDFKAKWLYKLDQERKRQQELLDTAIQNENGDK